MSMVLVTPTDKITPEVSDSNKGFHNREMPLPREPNISNHNNLIAHVQS